MLNIFTKTNGLPGYNHVDSWFPSKDQIIFTDTKGAFIAPIHRFYNMAEGNLIDYFYLTPKKCYNSDDKVLDTGEIKEGFRHHLTRYLNYFETYYDTDHLLLGIYANVKFFIDCYGDSYTMDMFMGDIYKYIISKQSNPILHYYIYQMNEDNYIPIASAKKDTRNPCLEYKDIHAKLLMLASLIQIMIIPLVSHFMYIKKIPAIEIQGVLIKSYDKIYLMILQEYGVDLYAKLYETITANIGKSRSHNSILWDMQFIRGINPIIHANNTLKNLIVQIVPKYVYNQSPICFNYNAICKDIKFKVTDVPYEMALVPVSSSDRDEDNNSQTDRFEAHMIKRSEARSIQYHVNAITTMKNIEQLYGPFNKDEIKFYIKRLSEGGKPVKTEFQSRLINFLFMREFEDTDSIKYVNNEEYIEMMLAAKKILYSHGICFLAEIISGKSEKVIARNNINKNMMLRMKMSENYAKVLDKYKIESIIEDMFKCIAQATASDYSFINYYNKDIDGQHIPVDKDVICEDFLKYILLID